MRVHREASAFLCIFLDTIIISFFVEVDPSSEEQGGDNFPKR